jgi:hypothetical protein
MTAWRECLGGHCQNELKFRTRAFDDFALRRVDEFGGDLLLLTTVELDHPAAGCPTLWFAKRGDLRGCGTTA